MLYTCFIYFCGLVICLILMKLYSHTIKWGKIYIHKSSNNDLLSLIMIGMPVFFILGNRYGIGSDYFNYERIYDNYILYKKSDMELGFKMLMRLSHSIFESFQGLVFITSFITVILMVNWILKEKTVQKAMMIYIMFCMFFASWGNIIRQSIAMAIVVYSFRYIEERKVLKYVVIILVASLFHTSALILLPCYFFGRKRSDIITEKNVYSKTFFVKSLVIVIGLIITAALYLKLAVVMNLKFSGYLTSNEGGTTSYFIRFAILLYIPEFVFLKNTIKNSQRYELYYLLVFSEMIFYLFGLKVTYGFRIAQYFSAAHIILIPGIINSINNNKEKKLVEFYFIVILLIQFIVLYIWFGYNGMMPYTSYR